ncbi:MAG: NADH-ubiquinone oxidoreductase chain N [uncultured Nocardioidaceae bacterium]|uniref:NADH-quinone oxidoreductase subunit N n=1 Tax=uncultured Nocardioidaceae bacterium TaxID=253824 RepID=A0A6J4MV32_9ACTN|nr:MAG: NADH-ubiquinone oxidoreductase chain N [uncultured Nocardioidaceae bacterium]
MTQAIDWWSIAAPLCLVSAALVALLGDAFVPAASRWLPAAASLGGCAGTLAFAVSLVDRERTAFCLAGGPPGEQGQRLDCSWLVTNPTLVWWGAVAGATAVVTLLLVPAVRRGELPAGELHFLLLSSATGALVVAAAGDLVTLVIGLETLSLPTFALVGLRRGDRRGAEAALKFFITSVVATAITLLGISMVYGATGSVAAYSVATAAALDNAVTPVIGVAMVLTVVGLAFKVAAVPFHAWVPDTYVGAPIQVAAYLSVVSKAAGLAGLAVVLTRFFGPYVDTWSVAMAVAAAATMTVGNLAALRQQHAVRLLAWSSVAQVGYLLVPLAAGGSPSDLAAQQSYVVMYAIVNLGAFAAVLGAAHGSAVMVDDFTGLVRSRPWLGAGLGFALLCLAGLPPGVVGLLAKVVIFQSAVTSDLLWLAVLMGVNVALALVYYLRFLAVLLRPVPSLPAGHDGSDAPAASGQDGVAAVRRSGVPLTTELVAGLSLGAAVVLSVFPAPLFARLG